MADIHPLITIFGVVIGLSLFGFMGVIFGPLLLSLFFLFVDMFQEGISGWKEIINNKNPIFAAAKRSFHLLLLPTFLFPEDNKAFLAGLRLVFHRYVHRKLL